jgi:DNA-binding transcriptional ArsR family regulator
MRPVATRSTAREEKDSVASSEAIQFAVGHPIRVATLAILAEGPSSPKEIAALLGEGVSLVGNHTRALRDRGCIEVEGTRRVGNITQPCYRLPEHPTNALGLLIQALAVELMGALRTRTLESDDDLLAAFEYMELDEQGRRDLARAFGEHQERVREIGATAERRLAASGGEGVATVVASMAFERCRPIKNAQGGSIRAVEGNIAANPEVELLKVRALPADAFGGGFPDDALIVEFLYRHLDHDSGIPGREVTVFAADGDVLASQDFG